jgi:hypothetical protein
LIAIAVLSFSAIKAKAAAASPLCKISRRDGFDGLFAICSPNQKGGFSLVAEPPLFSS